MSHRAPYDSSENVPSSLVGRENTFTDQEGDGPYVIGYDPDGNVFLFICFVANTCQFLYAVYYRLEQICVEIAVNSLHHRTKPFKTSSRIYVLSRKRMELSFFVLVILGENKVPYLHESPFRIGRSTLFALRTALRVPCIVKDLRIGTARPRWPSRPPEIVFFSHSQNFLLGKTYLFVPDSEGLFVFLVDGDPQFFFRNPKHLGEKLPGPLYGFFFEIVSKGEITEHFKERMVPWSLSHVLYINGSQTLLTGSHPRVNGFDFAPENGLERNHAGHGEEKLRIVRYERSTR